MAKSLGKKAFTNNPYLGMVIDASDSDVIADEQFRFPHGKDICRLGEKYKDKSLPAEKITPTYLRLPQASRELIKKRGSLK